MPAMTAHDPAALAPVVQDAPDDITDPPVPEALSACLKGQGKNEAAMLSGYMKALEDLHQEVSDTLLTGLQMPITATLEEFKAQVSAALHGLDQTLAAAVQGVIARHQGESQLAQALGSYAPCVPYSATISTLTPSGYPMTFTVQQPTQESFLAAMGGLLGFLREQGFAPLTLPQLME